MVVVYGVREVKSSSSVRVFYRVIRVKTMIVSESSNHAAEFGNMFKLLLRVYLCCTVSFSPSDTYTTCS